MLVGETGLLAGTVGGGCGEADVAVLARKVLAGHSAGGIVEVDLSGDFDQTAKQACGGTMDVLVERVGPELLQASEALAQSEEKRGGLWLAQPINSTQSSSNWRVLIVEDLPEAAKAAAQAGSDCVTYSANGLEWFAQAIGTGEQVIIVGSGHVAHPLARLAMLLGWRVTIVDDRPGYATAARFPGAEVHVGQHPEVLATLKPNRHCHVVIITRGHEHDEASLRETLGHSPAYVGMIGSKRRAIGTLKRLSDEGFSAELLDRVHTPIGLDIGAQTPEEIALAILAEIVARRRGGSGRPLMEIRPRPRG